LAQYSILIADGDPEYIQYLAGTLSANGFSPTGTSSGKNALDLYMAEMPDLVVADLNIAELNGLSLLGELRAFDPKARVILTTNLADKELVTRAFRMGALDVLEKPLDFEFLTNKIREVVSQEGRALEGTLQMMSLASIVQINCEERNQAQLILNNQGNTGSIYFQDGEMIHAEVNETTGEEAVYELLAWENGSFQLRMGAQPSLRTITAPWSGIILEGMRRIDESSDEWDSEWDEDPDLQVEDQEQDLQQRIAKAILQTKEVTAVVIGKTDGTLLAQENSSAPESEIQLGLQLSQTADNLRGFLDGGDLARVVITGADNRFYLHRTADYLLLLTLTKKASADTIHESIQTIQTRYQAA
jgi:DNA-binding response OmpR family regulator/predicted regulator of Ras-like GTPase activity (Roadblock/LC7/MglB family)